jgi:hypothetical protein
MKQILLGYRPYKFTDEKTGREVEGVSLYTQFESQDVKGYETAKVSAKTVPDNIDDYLGVELDIDFDQKGKVRQVYFPKPAAAPAK